MSEAAVPPIHAVTSDDILVRAGFADAALAVLEAGGRAVALHLRGPRTSGARLFALAAELAPAARRAGARLVVNDRVDVAVAAGADGVHLPEHGLDVAEARALVGAARWVGRSVHDSDGARVAAEAGADFLVAGPLLPTASHPGRPGRGVEWLREIAAAGAPVVAIGGITAADAAMARGAGAAGIAAIRAVWDAPDPAATVSDLRDRWEDA